MKTVVFAASKGGVGKTTLAFNVAVEAAKTSKVFVVDMDPQKSLEEFVRIRGGNNPLLLANVGSVPRTVADLQRTKIKRDYLIVDAPGSFMAIIEDSLKAADCIVVPMQPSPIDILAQEDVLKLIGDLGKLKMTLPVLTRVDGRTGIDDVVARIMKMFPTPHVIIKNRVAYQRGLIGGKAGSEIEGHCATEIAALWHAITRITGEGNG